MRTRLRSFTCLVLAVAAGACSHAPSDDDAASSEHADTELAPLTGDFALKTCDVAYGTVDSILELRTPDVAVSPDGKHLAYTLCGEPGGDRRLVLADLATGKRTSLDPEREIRRARFTPDGRFLYYAVRDRGADVKALRVEVRSLDGTVKKSIPLFSSFGTSVDSLVEGFDVRVSPDGKTAVAFGYESLGFERREGRVVVSPLDRDGETVLSSAFLAGIDSRADATFSPSGDRLLILSTFQDRPMGIGEARPMHVYDVTLGDTPRLQEGPAWVYAGGGSTSSTVIPGSFDGTRVLRWDPAPAGNGMRVGRLVSVGVAGALVDLSGDAKVVVPGVSYFRDSDMRGMNRAARYASSDPSAPVLFLGLTDANAKSGTLYARPRDGSAPAATVATNVTPLYEVPMGVVQVAPSGAALYATPTGLGLFDPAAKKGRDAYATPAGSFASAVAISADAAKALVLLQQKGADGNVAYNADRSYAIVDLASGKSAALAPPAGRALTAFGPKTPDQQPSDCGYDRIAQQTFDASGSPLLLVESFSELTTCKRAYSPPEIFHFAADGSFHQGWVMSDLTVASDRRGWADFPRLVSIPGDKRVLGLQCDVEGGGCAVKAVTIPPAPITPPAPGAGGGAGGAGGGTGEVPAPAGGGDDPAAPNDPSASGDPSSSSSSSPSSSDGSKSGGCSVDPRGAGGGSAWLLVLAASLFAVRGRRSRGTDANMNMDRERTSRA